MFSVTSLSSSTFQLFGSLPWHFLFAFFDPTPFSVRFCEKMFGYGETGFPACLSVRRRISLKFMRDPVRLRDLPTEVIPRIPGKREGNEDREDGRRWGEIGKESEGGEGKRGRKERKN